MPPRKFADGSDVPEMDAAPAPAPAPVPEPQSPPPPAKVRVRNPYGFFDDNNRYRSWAAGDVVSDAAEIAMLVERKVLLDAVA